MRPGEPTHHTQPVRWWRVDVNDWKSAPNQAWFTSSAAADRYVAGYAPDVLRHAVTVVGPVEVEER